MTRIGKIARLPLDVRDELNRRLHEGEKGRKLLVWLNQHPETKRVLAEDFGGREVNEVNLSDWKAGGYLEWLAEHELMERARELSYNAQDLAEVANGGMLDDLAKVLAIRYADLLVNWNGEVTVEFQRKLRALEPLSKSILALGERDRSARRMELKMVEDKVRGCAGGTVNGEAGAKAKEYERLLQMMRGGKT